MNHLVPSQPSQSGGSDRWIYSSAASSPPAAADGAPVDIPRLLTNLRRRWWLILAFGIVAGAFMWNQVRHRPHLYSASAVVQLVDSRDAWAGGLLKAGEDRTPIVYLTLSQVEIIRSRAVANSVVDSTLLGLRVNALGFSNALVADVALDENVATRRIPIFFKRAGFLAGSIDSRLVPYGMPASVAGVHFTILSLPQDVSQGFVTVMPRERAADRLLRGLDVNPRKQTNLIDISFTAADRASAQRIVNSIAHAYQAINTRMAQQQLHRRRVFIEDQLSRTDAQLAEADRALSTFRNQQQAYSSQEKFKYQQSALLGLDARREELDGDRKMARTLLRRFETSDESGRKAALSMLASASEIGGERSPIPELYRKLLDYQRSRSELTSGPTGKTALHPEVQRLDSLLASTQSEMISSARAHVVLLDARIEALDEARSRDANVLGQLPAAEAAETRLQQNADVLRTQAATLRVEYQQARIAEAAEVGQVEIVDLATRAPAVESGNTRLIVFAILFGLFVGALIAVVLETLDTTVKRRDDLESSLHVPVLATIPRIGTNVHRQNRLQAFSGRTNGNGTELGRRRNVALTSVLQSRSPGAEAFRHLGTNLFYSRNGQAARRILVTSPSAGDGKTSIAANLAITLAHQRHRVLLVDCDAYGKLHTIFQLPAFPGLSEVVLDGTHPAHAIHQSGVAGLSVMTSGQLQQRATDVVGSNRMRAMLRDMGEEFDLVILDCSPVLGLADSTILSVDSDVVLLVVRAAHTASTAAVEAMRHLSTVGARVAGVVLNDPEERARQYDGYHYGYSYAAR